MILPYVYRVTNRSTLEFYIGVRWANKAPAEEDLGFKYFTSSKVVKPQFDCYDREILAVFYHMEDAFQFEQQLIEQAWNNELCLNRQFKRGSEIRFKCSGHTIESRQKMSQSMKGRIPWNKGMVGVMSDGLKKSADRRRGIPLTPERRSAISKSLTGIKRSPVSDSTRQLMRQSKLKAYEATVQSTLVQALIDRVSYIAEFNKQPSLHHWRSIQNDRQWVTTNKIQRIFGSWANFLNQD